MAHQMAHAKNLGEPFMAHLENLYNIGNMYSEICTKCDFTLKIC